MSQQNKCPICQSSSIAVFLIRNQVPVHQNLLMKDQHSALEIPRGDLQLAVCEECGFIFNQTFEHSLLSYGDDYENTQACSSIFMQYLSAVIQHLVSDKGIQNCRIVEVGCGTGLFLRKLVEAGNNTGYGFDPSYVGPATDLGGRISFEKRYYGPDCVDIHADVVICRHVIEHVPNPMDMLQTIRQALVGSPQARVFFETPTVEWILRNRAFWDFFYEHCSYFSADSIATAFEIAGYQVKSIQQVFGEQYLWVEAQHLHPNAIPTITKKPGSIPQFAREFAALESQLIRSWQIKVKEIASLGKICIWGAGAKGVTFANLVDPERQWIAFIVDVNPQKQSHFIPGTGHQIIGQQELSSYRIRTALLMNPNYRDEVLAIIRDANLKIELIDLMELQGETNN